MTQISQLKVGLTPLITGINLPTVIQTTVLPGEKKERVFIATQWGEIYLLEEGNNRLFLDIQNRVLQLNQYDERGLLGLAFHPLFRKNGRFYLHYSMKNTQGPGTGIKSYQPNPCNPEVLKWVNRDKKYDHIDTLEEWQLNNGKIRKTKTILKLIRPFSNHNGVNSIHFSPETGKMLFSTGDGGSGFDPFNLSQNNDEIAGKIIELDVDQMSNGTSLAVTQFHEIPSSMRKHITIIAKGIRNSVGITYAKQNGEYNYYIGNVGQEMVESIYAFKLEKKKLFKQPVSEIINFGWRGWEGIMPTILPSPCESERNQTEKLAFFNQAVELSNHTKPVVSYFHEPLKHQLAGKSITGVQVYLGKQLPNHCLFFTDWLRIGGENKGFLGCAKLKDAPHNQLLSYEIANIDFPLNEPSYFVSLGTNTNQTRLFLGVYGSAYTTEKNKGAVYEVVTTNK